MTNASPAKQSFEKELEFRIRAGYPILYIPTTEESRVERIITRVAHDMKLDTCTWDCFEGFKYPNGATDQDKKKHSCRVLIKDDKPEQNPVIALTQVTKAELSGDALFIFRDLVDWFAQVPNVRRILRSYGRDNRLTVQDRRRPIVIVAPYQELDPRLRSAINILEFDLPGEAELLEPCEYVLDCGQEGLHNEAKAKALEEDYLKIKDELLQALLGLTVQEAEHAVSHCVVQYGGFNREMLKLIKDEKAAIIRKSETLNYIDEDKVANMNQIGGYKNYLDFIARRAKTYTKEARALNIDYPKGVILLGPPGTGKSIVAMATGKLLGLPVYTLDAGALFGSLVGASEARVRDAIRQITAQQGCVLLIDEADKAFGGASSASGDSGTTKRVFGTLLTWLATKQDRTFVIITMNRTTDIPPEFLRAGRFDAIFAADLPDEVEREEIIRIHLEKRGVGRDDVAQEVIDYLVVKTPEYTGAELEQVICEARTYAFSERGRGIPSSEDFDRARMLVTPVATLDAQSIADIRRFCEERNVQKVSEIRTKKKPASTKRAIGVDPTPSNN